MTSSVTFPLLATKYPRAHRCRPQNCLWMCLNSIISFRELLPLMYCMILLGDRFGGHDSRTWTWSREIGSLQDFNVVGPAYLPHQLSQTYANLANQHRLAVFRNPHKMVFQIVSRMRTVSVVFHDGPFYHPN